MVSHNSQDQSSHIEITLSTPVTSQNKTHEIHESWFQSLLQDWKMILPLLFLAAFTLLSYSLARGPSESLFLKSFDATDLPGLWIEIGFSVMLILPLYNKALQLFNLTSIFQISFWGSAISLALLMYVPLPFTEQRIELLSISLPIGRDAFIRIWCDLYIVILVETFWSIVNINFPKKSAPYLYGLLCAAGTLGSMAGNAYVYKYSESIGTESLIVLVIPIMIMMSLCAISLQFALKSKTSSSAPIERKNQITESSLWSSIQVVWQSKYLVWILAIVLLSQITVTLIDYQYKTILKDYFPLLDQRSQIQGMIYFSIDVGALVTQLLTGFILIRFGAGRTLVGISAFLGILALVPLFFPIFTLIAALKSSSKFLTYSLFKSAKEILYLPLTYREQTQGKALIDIMAYRQAKIIASILLLLLTRYQVSLQFLQYLTLASIVFWMLASIYLHRCTRV
jgi:ATP:ADP antiporter, AAA family